MLSRKHLIVGVIAIALVGCGDQAKDVTGPTSRSVAPSYDVANGNGVQANVTGHAEYLLANVNNAEAEYSFSAERHKNGEVKGELEYRTSLNGGSKIHGETVCLNVVGNSARIAARITQSNTMDAPTGMFLVWDVVDNGQGKRSAPDMTTALFLYDQPTAMRECLTGFVSLAPYFPVQEGNIQVH